MDQVETNNVELPLKNSKGHKLQALAERTAVVALVRSGKTRDEIAEQLGLSVNRVQDHTYYAKVLERKAKEARKLKRSGDIVPLKIVKSPDRCIKGSVQVYRVNALELSTELAKSLISELRANFNISPGETKLFEIVIAI